MKDVTWIEVTGVEVTGIEVTGVEATGIEVTGIETQKAFRGRVDLSKYDDRVDPDSPSVSVTGGGYIRPMPVHKTNDEIDRQTRYNQMMGRTGTYGMGYVFS